MDILLEQLRWTVAEHPMATRALVGSPCANGQCAGEENERGEYGERFHASHPKIVRRIMYMTTTMPA